MADSTQPAPAAAPATPPVAASGLPPWSQVWQLPVLLVGMALFGVGLYLSIPQQTHDDFPGALESATHFLQAGNLEEAQKKLNEIGGRINFATTEQQALHAQLCGDLVLLQIESDAPKFENADNRKKVHQWYTRAKELKLPFDGLHLQRWADTLVELDRQEEALKVLDELKDQPAERRHIVIKRLIQQRIKGTMTHDKLEEVASLMARYLQEIAADKDAARRRTEEIWAVDLQARLGMLGSTPQAIIDYLLRRIMIFTDQGGDKDLAPLMVQLARAYQRAGELGESRTWFRKAQQRLINTDKLNAEVLVGLGQIDVADAGGLRSSDAADVRSALENFTRAETEYPTSPAYIDALIGRADCEARIGTHADAVDHFARAVKKAIEEKIVGSPQAQGLVDTVKGHYATQSDMGNFKQALEYLTVLTPLYAGQRELPADLLLQLAITHEKIGRQRQASAAALLNVSDPTEAPAAAPAPAPGSAHGSAPGNTHGNTAAASASGHSPAPGNSHSPAPAATTAPTAANAGDNTRKVAMQEAAIHFAKAADHYARHAHQITISDDQGFGASLWNASNCYLEARQWKKAIEVYTEFVRTRPGDPRQLQALVQLGLAYQADGQSSAAARYYEQLLNDHPNSPEAYDSLVPLARCYITLNQNDRAKRVLLHVLTDHPTITPDSPTFQQALVEIGKLHYQLREFEPAIESLHKAVRRETGPEAPVLKFLLADAYRQSVAELNRTLEEGQPQSKKLALQSERTRRLEQSLDLYTQVVTELESRDAASLTGVEKLYHRNSFFYRGDCAYDLGRFEQAIMLYDQAANRFRGHPVSLVGLVQIVNAYCELGQVREAKVANDRAREQLKRIPESAFNDPNLPMTRQHWQDWLRWTNEMNLFGSQANGESGKAH